MVDKPSAFASVNEGRLRKFDSTIDRKLKSHNAIIGKSGMLAYLTYMAERLEQMHRLLKPTGSIYLHCDPTASHYLKILMDSTFGHNAFRREIIWSNEGQSGFKSKANNWIRGHDVLLYYLKSSGIQTFNKQYKPLDENTIRQN